MCRAFCKRTGCVFLEWDNKEWEANAAELDRTSNLRRFESHGLPDIDWNSECLIPFVRDKLNWWMRTFGMPCAVGLARDSPSPLLCAVWLKKAQPGQN